MKQYHDLLRQIKDKGTWKDAAREGMPRTLSLFGAQCRYDLSEGFPILTTKKINFKNIVVELLWFLKGDTNIKYLVDNGCNIWNEDAYNFYVKKLKQYYPESKPYEFEEFLQIVKSNGLSSRFGDYQFGDCGKQYGWLWRNWSNYPSDKYIPDFTDQIKDLIEGLKNSPMSRRHILTAWNPATLNDMALNACHVLTQFNCRPIPLQERQLIGGHPTGGYNLDNVLKVPKYYLDCHMYQRSADVFLG